MGEEIGVGGMGRVYKAHHRELGKEAAVKLLTESIFSTRAGLLRFAAEAKICSLLKHPNIVEIFDYDVECDSPYIVFEFVEGRDLSVMIDDRMPVPLVDLLEMMAQVADGLHYAHSQNVIHRDIKPDNILVLPNNHIKVTDFGIAKRGDISAVKTRTGVILGTPRYMSPEQAQANKLSNATDIYSLGVVIFELVAGVRPFEAPSDLEVLLKHLHEEPPRAKDVNKNLPHELDALLNRCLAKNAEERPQNAAEVAQELRNTISLLGHQHPLTVSLGCRKGTLESPFDKKLVKSGKRPLPKKTRATRKRREAKERSAIGKKRKASPAKTVEPRQAPTALRSALRYGWIPLLFLAVLGFVFSGGVTKTSKVANVEVVATSGKGAVVHWQSDWKSEKPQVLISQFGSEGGQSFQVISFHIEELAPNKELPYRYSLAITGLAESTSYTAAVLKRDGSKSLAKSFTTKKARKLDFHWFPEFDQEGNWLIQLKGKTPFNVQKASPLEVLNKEKIFSTTFANKFVYLVPSHILKNNSRLSLQIRSLDGEKHEESFPILDGFHQHCISLYEGYAEDYRSGTYWRAFNGKTGEPVKLMLELGAKFTSKDGVKSDELSANAWKVIERRLNYRGSWYRQASSLAPGVSELNKIAPAIHPLRWSAWFAMLPLINTQSAALLRKLKPHPRWGRAVLPERQIDISLGKAHLNKPTFEQEFKDEDPLALAQYPMLDTAHPMANRMVFSQESAGALLSRTRSLRLKGIRLASFNHAELEVFINDGALHRVFIGDLNNGKFKAILQTPESDSVIWEKALPSENYARIGMMMFTGLGSEAMTAKETITQLSEIAHPLDEEPGYRRRYYVKIPISALNEGKNTFSLTIMNSPSYYTALTFYAGTILRLQ